MNRTKRKNRRLKAESNALCRKNQREEAAVTAQQRKQVITQCLSQKTDPLASAKGFIRVIAKKAPKLIKDEESLRAIEQMMKVTAFRAVEDWQPRGRGYQALLVSLADHLFATYPTPTFLWSVFWGEPNLVLAKLITKVAQGASLRGLSVSGEFAVPLTKKQCHQLLQMPAKFNFIEALRYVQVMAAGGNLAFLEQWLRCPAVNQLQSAAIEQFWAEVLIWLCQQTELKPKMVLPLYGYIAYQKQQHGNFSLKGRTLPNMLALMAEWQDMERLKKLALGINLPESGFESSCWELVIIDKRTEKSIKQRWVVEEILSSSRLLQEGKTMNHCVYTYRGDASKGRCSLWSVSLNNKSKVTMEVRNACKQVVQVKGRNNREPTLEEWQVVRRWARENGLRCVS